jgi:nucleotide-binding universal stress UspA family protein
MDLRTLAPIIVAVDGGECADDAVDWAAAEAAAQRSPLRLVHALVPMLSMDPYTAGAMLESTAVTREAARQLLRDAVRRARWVAPELAVSTALLDGTVAWAVRREARAARLLVLGNSTRPTGVRALLSGSVSAGLAGHAPCPVIVLPHLVGPVAGAARVVVGVKRGRSCSAAVGFGLRAARQRGIPLTLVHVCRAAHARTAAGVDPMTFLDALGDRATGSAITCRCEEFPDVPVVCKLLGGQPAPALIAESLGAAMLVVASSTRGLVGRPLGSIGRAVLEHARCPIAIVRHDHATAAPTERDRRVEVYSAPR